MPLTPHEFRRALSALAAGVCVVTVQDAAGRATGMTATSVTSLSLEPPLLLVCVGRDAALHDTIVAAPSFGVVLLARGQQEFAGGEPATPAGLPRIAGALGTLDCRRQAVLPGGDHSIVVGVVEWADTATAEPLLYFRSRYVGLRP